jgi:O-antigen chain-terminating methyltransferase
VPGEVKKTFTTAGISSVDASEHFERLKQEVRGVAPARPPKREESPRDARSEAEARWSVAVDRPIVRRPGLRGWLVYPLKRVLRKLMSWYVGPFAAEQRAFNEALLHLADELSARNDELLAALAQESGERRSAVAESESALQGRLEQEAGRLAEHAAKLEARTDQLGAAVDERKRLVAEIEERLLRLERRRTEAGPATVAAQPGAGDVPDYFAFESRMRGDTAEIRARQREYLEDFRNSGPVLDLGCGRGEFVALLGEAGIEARGIDADADMVAYARGEGLDVEQADALAALEALEDGSLGGVFAAQLLEHLPPPTLVRLLELAAEKLRPGGVFVAETINPLSPLALRNYFADLTHAQPLVPETLELLARQAGFAEVEKRFLNEPEERLTVPDDPVLARNVTRLNELLFGPLDYAIVARR